MHSNQKRAVISYTNIKINRSQLKIGYQRQRSLHVNESFHTTKRYNNINIYTPNDKLKICEGKTDRVEERNSPTVIVGDFTTPLTIMDRKTRQKISKKIEDLTQ